MSPTLPSSHAASPRPPAPPWWRERFMWLVVGGPALVVVAGVATVVIATRGADSRVPSRAMPHEARSAPALQGRNHAATPADGAPDGPRR